MTYDYNLSDNDLLVNDDLCACADCDPGDWFWPQLLTERALVDDDDDAARCLPYAVDHVLRLLQRVKP